MNERHLKRGCQPPHLQLELFLRHFCCKSRILFLPNIFEWKPVPNNSELYGNWLG